MKSRKSQNELTLEEQRDNVRNAIGRAMGRNDFKEVERLEGHLAKLDEQIERARNE